MATDPMATDPAMVSAFRRAAAHPYKLVVDGLAVPVAMIPLWTHQWLLAALVAIVPGLVATAVVAASAGPTAAPAAVAAVATWVQGIRLVALVVAGWAAWTHRLPVLVVAVLAGAVVLLPWPGARQSEQ